MFGVPPLGGDFTQRPPLGGILKPPALRVVDDLLIAWCYTVVSPILIRGRAWPLGARCGGLTTATARHFCDCDHEREWHGPHDPHEGWSHVTPVSPHGIEFAKRKSRKSVSASHATAATSLGMACQGILSPGSSWEAKAWQRTDHQRDRPVLRVHDDVPRLPCSSDCS
jgi:hypothetical protein